MIQDLTEPFFDYFATKSNTNTSPHRHSDTPPEPGALIEVQSPSEGITHAGSIKFSRFGHTPQPPILRGGGAHERQTPHLGLGRGSRRNSFENVATCTRPLASGGITRL